MQQDTSRQATVHMLESAPTLAVDLADIPGKIGSLPEDPSKLGMPAVSSSVEEHAVPLPKLNTALRDALDRPRAVSWRDADPTPVVRA